MTLPASGVITMGDVNTELGYASTTLITLNDTAVRTLFGIASGAISLNDGHGKSNTSYWFALFTTGTAGSSNWYNGYAPDGYPSLVAIPVGNQYFVYTKINEMQYSGGGSGYGYYYSSYDSTQGYFILNKDGGYVSGKYQRVTAADTTYPQGYPTVNSAKLMSDGTVVVAAGLYNNQVISKHSSSNLMTSSYRFASLGHNLYGAYMVIKSDGSVWAPVQVTTYSQLTGYTTSGAPSYITASGISVSTSSTANTGWVRKSVIPHTQVAPDFTLTDTVADGVPYIDGSDNLYLVLSLGGLGGGTSLPNQRGGQSIAKINNSDGTVAWCRRVYNKMQKLSIGVESGGAVWFTGAGWNYNSYTNGDFVAKMDSSGTLLWSKMISWVTYFPAYAITSKIAVDSSGNAYVVYPGPQRIEILKINSSGVLQWSRTIKFVFQPNTTYSLYPTLNSVVIDGTALTISGVGNTPWGSAGFIYKIPLDGSRTATGILSTITLFGYLWDVYYQTSDASLTTGALALQTLSITATVTTISEAATAGPNREYSIPSNPEIEITL